MDMTAQPQQETPDPAMAQADDDAGSYTIEIEVSADGSMTVSVETAAQEGAEQPGADESADEAQSRPASSIKEALTIALEIFKADGKMPQAGADEQAFNAGYQAKSGQPGAM